MGLQPIFESGIRTLVAEHASELEGVLDEASVGALRDALIGASALLVELDRVTFDENAPMVARAMFPAISSYLWCTDDHVPAREGQMIKGIVDDMYLVYRAAEVVQAQLGSEWELEKPLEVMGDLLGEDVVKRLDALIAEAAQEVEQQARALEHEGR